jgi:hypothetical protein
MRRLELTGRLSVFNRYLKPIYLVDSAEVERVPRGVSFIICKNNVKPETIFLSCLVGHLANTISSEVRWSDAFRKEYKVVTDFTGILYDEGYNEYYIGGGVYDPADDVLDLGSYINADVLMQLKLLPPLFERVIDNIGLDMNRYTFNEGYNKKLGACIGNYSPVNDGGNLIIIDISASIPIGVSDSLLYLASTMAYRMQADVILTGGQSYFYPLAEAIRLDAREERNNISRANEREMYKAIVEGLAHQRKHYANIVAFGDNDSPGTGIIYPTTDNLWSYHTQQTQYVAGYVQDIAKTMNSNNVHKQKRDWVRIFNS